jgi:NAD(P)-dependent dehydrogenase (short-subunit alcohol dehydrogenase family)
MDFMGQTVLVTGASRGIGRATALAFAAAGACIAGHQRKPGDAAVKGLPGGGHKSFAAELSDPHQCERLVQDVAAHYGRIDVLVNNAGITFDPAFNIPLEERAKVNTPSVSPMRYIRGIFETNVFGLIAVTQAMLPLLREAPAGRIVNMGSSSGSLTLNANPNYEYRQVFGAAYSPSKTTVHAITLAFAIELEKTNIKVNAACPGFTATDLNGFRGTRTVEQGAREAMRLALIGPDGPTGTLSDEDGPVPW